MEWIKQPDQMGTARPPPAADTIQWGDQTGIVFSPRPFLKTEQILVDQQPPPVKTEPSDNEDVKCEINSGFIKREQEVACKEDPDLLTVKTEPVESVHIKSLSDCGPVKMESVDNHSFFENSDTPASSTLQIGEFFSFLLELILPVPLSTSNQNLLTRSYDWLSPNQGPTWSPDSSVVILQLHSIYFPSLVIFFS